MKWIKVDEMGKSMYFSIFGILLWDSLIIDGGVKEAFGDEVSTSLEKCHNSSYKGGRKL